MFLKNFIGFYYFRAFFKLFLSISFIINIQHETFMPNFKYIKKFSTQKILNEACYRY